MSSLNYNKVDFEKRSGFALQEVVLNQRWRYTGFFDEETPSPSNLLRNSQGSEQDQLCPVGTLLQKNLVWCASTDASPGKCIQIAGCDSAKLSSPLLFQRSISVLSLFLLPSYSIV